MQRPVWQGRRWLVIGLTVAGIVWTVVTGGFTAFEPGRVWCSAAVAPAVGRAYHRFRWRRIDYRPVRRS
jgi:hypothetical protein